MEDKLKSKDKVYETEVPVSIETMLERKQSVAIRDKLINRARAAVIRSQVVRAYEIIDNIRFTPGLSDTAFRDMISGAKKGLEHALNDFLLSDKYHEDKLKKIESMTPKEYNERKLDTSLCVPCKEKDK